MDKYENSQKIKRKKVEDKEMGNASAILEDDQETTVQQLLEKQKKIIAMSRAAATLKTEIEEPSEVFIKMEDDLDIKREEEFEYAEDDEANSNGSTEGLVSDECKSRTRSKTWYDQSNSSSMNSKGVFPKMEEPDESPLSCELCKKTFTDAYILLEHITTEHLDTCSNKPQCPICPSITKYGHNGMKTHIRIAHVESQLKCRFLCSFQTMDRLILQKHMLEAHKTIRPFRCVTCERSFKDKCDFDKHTCLRGRTEVKTKLKCAKCNFTCVKQATLYRHIMTPHMGVVCKFVCCICQMGFSCKTDLVAHWSRVHVESKKFKCEICEPTSFDHLNTLTLHRRKCHGESNMPAEMKE